MISIRFRSSKRARWQTREFERNIDAEQFCKSLPEADDVIWGGSADRPDPSAPQRAMWTGAVSFGMVNVPIRLYSAVEDGKPTLHQICREHGSRMRFRRWCEHGHELGAGDTMHGVELAGNVIPIPDDDLKALPKGLGKAVQIAEFVPAGEVPAMHRDRPYFVGPDKTGRHAYDLLVSALRDTGTVAICSLVIREHEHLAALEPSGDGLVLWTLRRDTEIRSNVGLPNTEGESAIVDAERVMARELVRSMTQTTFEPARHPDRYAAALVALVEHKAEAAVPTVEAPNVVDLMASLRNSVDSARKARTTRSKAS